jgi:hypothetical protein
MFSGFGALIICLAADMFPVILLIVICISKHHVAKWLFFGYAALTVLAHVVTFICNAMVFRMVSLNSIVIVYKKI